MVCGKPAATLQARQAKDGCTGNACVALPGTCRTQKTGGLATKHRRPNPRLLAKQVPMLGLSSEASSSKNCRKQSLSADSSQSEYAYVATETAGSSTYVAVISEREGNPKQRKVWTKVYMLSSGVGGVSMGGCVGMPVGIGTFPQCVPMKGSTICRIVIWGPN